MPRKTKDDELKDGKNVVVSKKATSTKKAVKKDSTPKLEKNKKVTTSKNSKTASKNTTTKAKTTVNKTTDSKTTTKKNSSKTSAKDTPEKSTTSKNTEKKSIPKVKAETEDKSATKKKVSKNTDEKKLSTKIKVEIEDKPVTKKKTSKKVTEKKSTSKTKSEAKTSKTSDKKSNDTKKKTTKKPTTKKAASKTTKKTTANKTTSKTTKKSTTTKKVSKKLATNKEDNSSLPVLEYYDLPYRYNQTVVKVLAQNPHTLFVYWDISDNDREYFKKNYGDNFFNVTKPVLVVNNLTDNYTFEIDINDFANNWYIHVDNAKCQYSVTLGRRAREYSPDVKYDYLDVAYSNEIEIPNDHILYFKENDKIYFKNIKTNKVITKIFKNHIYGNSINEIYKNYNISKNQDVMDIQNPSSDFLSTNIL